MTSALAMRRYGIPAGIGTALAVGCLAGLVNGLVVAKLKVFPFIATLATMSIMSGLALQLSAGVPVTGVPDSFSNLAYDRLFGIPMPVVIAMLVLVVAALILRYTRVGRHIYAVGGNEEAARLSGIEIDRVKVFAIPPELLCRRRLARPHRPCCLGQPTLGVSLPLEAVSAVVLGGVSLFGAWIGDRRRLRSCSSASCRTGSIFSMCRPTRR